MHDGLARVVLIPAKQKVDKPLTMHETILPDAHAPVDFVFRHTFFLGDGSD